MGSNQSKLQFALDGSDRPARDTAAAVRIPRPSDNIRQWASYGITRVNQGGYPPQLQLVFSCGTFSPADYTRYQHDLQTHRMTTIDAPESFAITVVQGRPAWDFVRNCRTGYMPREVLCGIYDAMQNFGP